MSTKATSRPFVMERAQTVQLTENQKKVIEEKYLKGAPSVEAWLGLVARNIAYAELLYHASAHRWGLFDGVRVTKQEVNTSIGTPAAKSWFFHPGLATAAERDINFRRFMENCAEVIQQSPEAAEAVSQWERRFFDLMSSWRFLPNSPTLMNAGRDLQQLSACYVLPVEDSMEGITHALQAQALIHKSGGGTGFSFGRLRAKGDPVRSTAGVASGVISFMQVFDKMTGVVKQGGNRRGANMGILPYSHPEIKDFIRLKSRPGMLENFNISVSIDNKFLEAVENNWEYDLISPKTGEAAGRASAREVFDLMIESAWKSGDPGIVFIDRINEGPSNPTPGLGQIEATNPCGEQPLLPNEPCNLGSINLSSLVTGEITKGRMDWEELTKTIYLAVRFLDNVIDVNNYPLPEIERLAKGNRRIGLGVMGWAEALVKMGIPYDSEEAVKKATEVMSFISQGSKEASERLAEERGAFPNWKGSIFDPASPHFRGAESQARHCARTTIAPTGTIGLAAGLQGAGIEPFFAIAYTRYTAKALEAVKSGAAPNARDVYFEVNPLFKALAEKNNFFGLGEKDLWAKIERNGKSVRGIAEIPQHIQSLFATSHDVPVDFHVKMQAAFQAHTDNGVSKTVNLPASASLQDVRNAFLLAHRSGCKGITIYRDGSKKQQVLNLAVDKRARRPRDLAAGVSSEYYEIKTGHGPLHVHIDYDETGPYRIFASISPVGTETAGLTHIIGILLSKYLEEGGDPTGILKHLNSIKGDRPFGLGENKVNSIPHGIGVALRTHLQKHGRLEEESDHDLVSVDAAVPDPTISEDAGLELWNLAHVSDQCPECYSTNVAFSSACSGPVCHDCGHSECN